MNIKFPDDLITHLKALVYIMLEDEKQHCIFNNLFYYLIFPAQCCDTYVKNYNEQKTSGRSVNDNVAGTVKSIKETILSKEEDSFDARYNLDITFLNRLIIYSTFRSIYRRFHTF